MTKYDYALWAGLALWLAETAYFGWNMQAGSVQEEVLNTISLILMVYGVVGSWIKSIGVDIIIVSGESEISISSKK